MEAGMFSRQIKLFKLFGFEVGLDLSWVLLALLITWTLAVGYFPTQYPGLGTDTYWWMAIVGALGLFFSIIFHERSEEHTSELQSLMRISYAVFCLKKKNTNNNNTQNTA